jgi:hypothetical protein
MSRIIIGKSGGHNVGFDLDVLLPSRLLITADSGGGKSWVMRVLQEQAFGKVQIITIDPEGEFATLREKFPFVLVGKGGETPADVRSAVLVAQRLLQLRASAICDIYDMKPQQRHSWVKLFIEGLIEAPKELRNPLLLIVDEAHVFGPEKGESEALGAMVDAATRGRKRGICLVCATQRLAMLNKDITSNLQNRLVGPTFEDVNRKRAGEMLGVLPGQPMREFFHQIQLLKPGNFFAFGRAISADRMLVEIGDVQTTHPKSFGTKHSAPPPPTPDTIKALLPKLADLPKEAEEKARTEADFRREIRDLKTKLTIAEKATTTRLGAPATVDSNKVKLQIEREIKAALKARDAAWLQSVRAFQREFEQRLSEVAKLVSTNLRFQIAFVPPAVTEIKASVPDQVQPQAAVFRTPITSLQVPGVKEPRSMRSIPANGSGELGKLALQIAGILAAYYPQPMKRSILAAMCGVQYGGHFSNNLSALRTAGLLDDVGQGVVKGTEKCAQEYMGTFNPPSTTEEVLQLWDPKLGVLARQIIRKLVEANGEPLSRNDVAAALGVQYGGHFSNNLSDLRTAALLVDAGKGLIAANRETLFLPDHAA